MMDFDGCYASWKVFLQQSENYGHRTNAAALNLLLVSESIPDAECKVRSPVNRGVATHFWLGGTHFSGLFRVGSVE